MTNQRRRRGGGKRKEDEKYSSEDEEFINHKKGGLHLIIHSHYVRVGISYLKVFTKAKSMQS